MLILFLALSINYIGDIKIKNIGYDENNKFISTTTTLPRIGIEAYLGRHARATILFEKEFIWQDESSLTLSDIINSLELKRAYIETSLAKDNIYLKIGRSEVGNQYDQLIAYYYSINGIELIFKLIEDKLYLSTSLNKKVNIFGLYINPFVNFNFSNNFYLSTKDILELMTKYSLFKQKLNTKLCFYKAIKKTGYATVAEVNSLHSYSFGEIEYNYAHILFFKDFTPIQPDYNFLPLPVRMKKNLDILPISYDKYGKEGNKLKEKRFFILGIRYFPLMVPEKLEYNIWYILNNSAQREIFSSIIYTPTAYLDLVLGGGKFFQIDKKNIHKIIAQIRCAL